MTCEASAPGCRTWRTSASTPSGSAPWYPSPLADGGYDVTDHRDIHPMFGTLADADAVLAEAHALGLRVIVDVVANHTSDQHPWFRAALAAPPGSPERARYFFRDGLDPGRAAQQLDQRLRRLRLVTGHEPTAGRPVVPAPVRAGAARPRLGEPRGRRRVRGRAAVLVRPRRGRRPGRRRARARQGRGHAGRRLRRRPPVRHRRLGRQPALGRRPRARDPAPVACDRRRLRRRPGLRRRGDRQRAGAAQPLPAARRDAHRLQLPVPQGGVGRRACGT